VTPDTLPDPSDQTLQTLLVFGLSGEAFALPVSAIHEVIDPLPVTPVPNAPAHAPGLINVRGIVTPMVDVRMRLRMPQKRDTTGNDAARIIVLDLPVGGSPTRVAIEADAVHEVIEIEQARLSLIPELGARWPAAFVRGVARHDDRLVVLLVPDTLFAPDDHAPAQTA